MTETTISKRQASATAGRIEVAAGALFADCLGAFHAFGELPELAENLRILSLNAELAAGRAGEKGRAVRALTQYTRELVNRLAHIQSEMSRLEATTYGQSAATLRELYRLRLLESTARAVAETQGEYYQSGREAVEKARRQTITYLAETLSEMNGSVERLASRTRVVAEVVAQSDSIATNIAIEAAAAGVHEKEFRTVADTMRTYVEDLRHMIEAAGQSVADAANKGHQLQRMGFGALSA
ncbi:chemotaxis protein [Telmatospirillum sp. J64-1]|uniref:chemotaxis protein n=1 Tax=Telmatospirillum sp. J64-1 TaxID=2502183 RepID=UPI00115F4309|nr:chemotaxis protein [Telmatospirillum sp. J64-1]